MVNQFKGLARGPIDHNSSSVINCISNSALNMGDVVIIDSSIVSTEILPRVLSLANTKGNSNVYGIVVGGDADGVYGNGDAATDDTTRATTGAGQGVVVCTQGRCLARVKGIMDIGVKLVMSATQGVLETRSVVPPTTGEFVIATALQNILTNNQVDIIAVDVNREGLAA